MTKEELFGTSTMKKYNLNKVFFLQEADENQAIIKVNATDSLTVAKYPFISSDYAYLTVTRGKDHNFTIIKQNGQTFSFHFGESGHTLISENLQELKVQAMKFLSDNGIIMDYDGKTPVGRATIYFNPNFHRYQLTLYTPGDAFIACVRAPEATDLESAKEYFERFIQSDNWKSYSSSASKDAVETKNFVLTENLEKDEPEYDR